MAKAVMQLAQIMLKDENMALSQLEVPHGLRGTYYEDTVPATLELADHAALGLQHFANITDEALNYEWMNP